jgi:hypothetical protein
MKAGRVVSLREGKRLEASYGREGSEKKGRNGRFS